MSLPIAKHDCKDKVESYIFVHPRKYSGDQYLGRDLGSVWKVGKCTLCGEEVVFIFILAQISIDSMEV